MSSIQEAGSYGQDWTPKDRLLLRDHNIPIIDAAFQIALDQMSDTVGRRSMSERRILLSGLAINTKLHAEEVTLHAGCVLKLDINTRRLSAEIRTNQGKCLAYFDIPAFIIDDQELMGNKQYGRVLRLGGTNWFQIMRAETFSPNEGNGLGSALVRGTHRLIPQWLNVINLGSCDAVVAYAISMSHFSGSPKNAIDQRNTWTPQMLTSLGYSNDPTMIHQYISSLELSYAPSDSSYVKVIHK